MQPVCFVQTHKHTDASSDYGAEVFVWHVAGFDRPPQRILPICCESQPLSIRCRDSESHGRTSHFLITHTAVVLNSSMWFIYWWLPQLDRDECSLLSSAHNATRPSIAKCSFNNWNHLVPIEHFRSHRLRCKLWPFYLRFVFRRTEVNPWQNLIILILL